MVRLDADDDEVAAVTATLAIPLPHERLEKLPGTLTIRVLNSVDEGKTFVVRGPRITGGRRRPGDGHRLHQIELNDDTVSTDHFEIHRTAHGLFLRDLMSTNGTWCGGRVPSEGYGTCIYPCRSPESRSRFWAGNVQLQLEGEIAEKRSVYKAGELGELRGSSPSMREIYSTVERVAPTRLGVLICGETGTGKGVVARTIHEMSGRQGPFRVLDCTMLSHGMAESQIMGHKRGAFTGAVSEAVGFFESAHGGTLFLDELAEIPLELQSKLLRVIEDGEVHRLGETKARKVDVRVIGATNRNVDLEVCQGRFRRDLFYRIAKIVIKPPPLRERKSDIALLANFFLEEGAREAGQIDHLRSFSADAIAALESAPWEGNVRQLRTVIERTSQLVSHDVITTADLCRFGDAWRRVGDNKKKTESAMANLVKNGLSLHEFREHIEGLYCIELLELHEGNVRRAAAAANITSRWFRTLLERAYESQDRGE